MADGTYRVLAFSGCAQVVCGDHATFSINEQEHYKACQECGRVYTWRYSYDVELVGDTLSPQYREQDTVQRRAVTPLGTRRDRATARRVKVVTEE